MIGVTWRVSELGHLASPGKVVMGAERMAAERHLDLNAIKFQRCLDDVLKDSNGIQWILMENNAPEFFGFWSLHYGLPMRISTQLKIESGRSDTRRRQGSSCRGGRNQAAASNGSHGARRL